MIKKYQIVVVVIQMRLLGQLIEIFYYLKKHLRGRKYISKQEKTTFKNV